MRARPHFNPFLVREPEELPDWKTVFKNKNPLDLEIGFSSGKWLIGYAQKFPKRNIVGVEIRGIYIDYAKEKLKKLDLANVYVLKANINTALNKLFQPQAISNVFVMFPDPWYKKKHLKRRVIHSAFIQDLYTYMQPEGLLHIATDQQGLAQDMLLDLERSLLFENLHGVNNFAPENIPELITDIEKYNLQRGKPIYRMAFRRK